MPTAVLDRGSVRKQEDNPHPVVSINKDLGYSVPQTGWRDTWYGFSLIPHIIIKDFYDEIGPYSQYINEEEISKAVYKANGKVVTLYPGVCQHIGWDRHVEIK